MHVGCSSGSLRSNGCAGQYRTAIGEKMMTMARTTIRSIVAAALAVFVAGCDPIAGPQPHVIRPVTVSVLDLTRNEPLEGVVVCASWYTAAPACFHGDCLRREVRHAEGVTDQWGQVTFAGTSVPRSGVEVLPRMPITFVFRRGYVGAYDPRRSYDSLNRILQPAKEPDEALGEIRDLLEHQSDSPYHWQLTKFPRLREEVVAAYRSLPSAEQEQILRDPSDGERAAALLR
jgi:hypothetical protein